MLWRPALTQGWLFWIQVNLSCAQQTTALGALLRILQKHALLPTCVPDGDAGPVCVVEDISEVRNTSTY